MSDRTKPIEHQTFVAPDSRNKTYKVEESNDRSEDHTSVLEHQPRDDWVRREAFVVVETKNKYQNYADDQ